MHCFFFCISVDENNPYEVCDLGNFSIGLAVKRSATERYFKNMLRFQRSQSKFSFKLNILSSKRFHAVLIWILLALILLRTSFLPAIFCFYPAVVAFARGEKKLSARFVANAFIDHICRIKDMSCEPVSVEPIKRLEIHYS